MKKRFFGGKLTLTIIIVLFCMALGLIGCGDDDDNASDNDVAVEDPATLDTPEIIAALQVAIDLAGEDESLIRTQRQQCKTEDLSRTTEHVHFEPIQIFDNFYMIGNEQVCCFVFTTTDGYIMIDAMREGDPEGTIIPDMEMLGLDPAQVKYIMITHAGGDHMGGVPYFQENYGTHVVMSQFEWDALPVQDMIGTLGDEDIAGTDGLELTLGDTTITMVRTPRRAGEGGLSFIGPVFDNGEPHMWATFGNTGVAADIANKIVYRESVAKFLEYTDAAGVDVVISDHPFVDNSVPMIEELRNLQPGEPNPFVYTQERARRFFEILDQSALVLLLRELAGLNDSGTELLTDVEER